MERSTYDKQSQAHNLKLLKSGIFACHLTLSLHSKGLQDGDVQGNSYAKQDRSYWTYCTHIKQGRVQDKVRWLQSGTETRQKWAG